MKLHHASNEQEWNEAFSIMDNGGIAEIDEEFYNHMLNALPPLCMNDWSFTVSEPHDFDEKGKPVYHKFWMKPSSQEQEFRFFGSLTTTKWFTDKILES